MMSRDHSGPWLVYFYSSFLQLIYIYISVKTFSKPVLSLLVCIPFFIAYFYSIFALALLLILVHSFYSWDKKQQTNHLYSSFEQFFNSSSQSTVIASAVKQAIKSCGRNLDLLCEAIIQIVLQHSSGGFVLILFNIHIFMCYRTSHSCTPTLHHSPIHLLFTIHFQSFTLLYLPISPPPPQFLPLFLSFPLHRHHAG